MVKHCDYVIDFLVAGVTREMKLQMMSLTAGPVKERLGQKPVQPCLQVIVRVVLGTVTCSGHCTSCPTSKMMAEKNPVYERNLS